MSEIIRERLDITLSERDPRVTISLSGARGNIRVGGSGTDGDLLLFPEVADLNVDPGATIWLASGHGNLALGGNGTDGDILLFPAMATNSTTETAEASIWLDADPGHIRLKGGLMPKEGPVVDRQLPGFSVEEGATAAFQGSARFGVIDFTHKHPAAVGDREKLREIWIFNPLLHANSIALVTAHAGASVTHMIGNMESRHEITGGIGRFIKLSLERKLAPGTRMRLVYWILN